MGVGSYVGAGLLMIIPVIGWIICIVWACGGSKNLNRRNYARATLIFMIIGAVVGFLLFLLFSWLLGTALDVFREVLSA
jgi:hypothetical protein